MSDGKNCDPFLHGEEKFNKQEALEWELDQQHREEMEDYDMLAVADTLAQQPKENK